MVVIASHYIQAREAINYLFYNGIDSCEEVQVITFALFHWRDISGWQWLSSQEGSPYFFPWNEISLEVCHKHDIFPVQVVSFDKFGITKVVQDVSPFTENSSTSFNSCHGHVCLLSWPHLRRRSKSVFHLPPPLTLDLGRARQDLGRASAILIA